VLLLEDNVQRQLTTLAAWYCYTNCQVDTAATLVHMLHKQPHLHRGGRECDGAAGSRGGAANTDAACWSTTHGPRSRSCRRHGWRLCCTCRALGLNTHANSPRSREPGVSRYKSGTRHAGGSKFYMGGRSLFSIWPACTTSGAIPGRADGICALSIAP
jgi:hypothetical protein